MTSDDSSPAAAQVLALPELLENILLNLDPYQLFVIQRVDSTFKGVIEGSKGLRRRMFVEACDDTASNEGEDFMRAPQMQRAVWPLRVSFAVDCFSAQDLVEQDLVDLDLTCEWVREHSDRTREQLLEVLQSYLKAGSWQHLKCVPRHKMHLAVGCRELYLMPKCNARKMLRDASLRNIVGKAHNLLADDCEAGEFDDCAGPEDSETDS